MQLPKYFFFSTQVVSARLQKVFAALFCLSLPFTVASATPGAGGPDAFGYNWIDSDEAGGPSFNYIDISSSGTLVNGFEDDNYTDPPIPIGFTFKFYGVDYTEFYIASNGFIGFGPADDYWKYNNGSLPNSSTPNNIIAWLWDDLIPRNDTKVYYQSFADKLVVQFVKFGNNNTGADNARVNAQVILYSNGKVLFQYLSFTGNWPFALSTVGLENADGTDGLTVVHNAAYLHNELALQFTSGATAPDTPTLVSPINNAIDQPTTVTLQWSAAGGADSYRLQVATNVGFANKVFDDSTLTGTSKQVGPLANNQAYYWRVNAKNAAGTSAWPAPRKLTTLDNSKLGEPVAVNTKSGYQKSNQSKVFYHDSQWWALALHDLDDRWYIWRYTGSPAMGASWIRVFKLNADLIYAYDAVVNPNTGKLYLFGSHKTAPRFWRLSYSPGAWSLDTGYPVALPDFTNPDQGNPVSLVRAKNGNLWIFRIINRKLQAKRSINDGKTWSATINVKNGLQTIYGTTDVAAYTFDAGNYVGVAYAERDTIGSKYGFLFHRDGEPDGDWTDESAELTFFGAERAFNSICLTSDANNNLYLITRNLGTGSTLSRNTLYKRSSAGVWQKFKINSTALVNWKSPAIAIDKSSNLIYCMGVNVTSSMVEYKTCKIGKENTLDTAQVQTLFSMQDDVFDNLSVPAVNLTGPSGLMACADNVTASDIWYRLLATGDPPPAGIGAITVNSEEINANATYTIPLSLSNTGALAADAGKLHFRFPSNTNVPEAITPSEVLVDGTPATSIISSNTTKQVTIVTPANLPNNHAFFVVFNPGAGLLNATTPGNSYTLTAWTSAQPVQIRSPIFSLKPATTTVTPAVVTPSTVAPGNPADYTIEFNLGDHGRMLSGTSTFTIKFSNATQVKHGSLSGVTVDSILAVANGDSASRQITIKLPSTVSLGNNATVKLFLPSPAVLNPTVGGSYKLSVATSVETAPVDSDPYLIPFLTGNHIEGTTKKFDRSNQSKMFYHGGIWWVAAQDASDLKWYIWKLDGAAWTKNIQLHTSAKIRPDCVLDAPNNKVYILLPGGSVTYIARFTFASGNWVLDAGYPCSIPDFPQNSDYGMNLVRANNGHLWVFRMANSTLYARRSSNGGKNWTGDITIKTGLNHSAGLTDAVAFFFDNAHHIGVGYAENSTEGSIYGFLRHKDSAADGNWTDETGAIPQFPGTVSDDHISMTVHNHTVFMAVKTNGGGPTAANVGLLRRHTNGAWFRHPVLLSHGWTRPVVVIDKTHNRLYLFGTREGPIKYGEMKHVAIGQYNSLVSTPSDTIFSNDENDNFFDVSVPAHPVNSTMNLLVGIGNDTRNELWYKIINLSATAKASRAPAVEATVQEESFEGVKVFPNPFNPETSFRFKVPEQGPDRMVKLQIFNLNGQVVRTLVDELLPPGIHQRRWNGHNSAGHRVASGIYLYRLQIGGKVIRGRVQMIK